MIELIIYDFDGVIADSEAVSNVVLAEMLSDVGLPTTYEDALRDYCGRRWRDCAVRAEEKLGRPLPSDFGARREAEVLRRLALDLEMVPGAREFIDTFANLERCIGSSSAPPYLNMCLAKLGLADRFEPTRIFSAATHVQRGKPHPDLFLYAASQLGTHPEACLVIEDSPHGVEAGVTAGMTVVGLCAGSHVREGHDARLRAAGAHHVMHNFGEAERIVRELLA